MTRLQWFGLLGAPFAWTVQHVAGYWLTEVRCERGGVSGLSLDAWVTVITAIAASVALLSALAAIRAFRATRGARGAGGAEEDPPQGRIHFLATVGIAIAPLFFFIIVMDGVGVAILQNCHQG
ncbi:MAG TPA: hypothetical protein VGF21_09985 [Thermoleophilaceae bacterium]|jgi:hypothetical protein